MLSKAFLLLSVQALLLKCALSQCFGRGFYGAGLGAPYGFGFGGYGYGGYGYGGFPAAGWAGGWGLGYGGWGGLGGYGGYGAFGGIGPAIGPAVGIGGFGGGLAVTSASPIAPIGLVVTSENLIEGAVDVAGTLPFLGAVATDGAFPTAGAGAIAYGCGDGAVGIATEGPVAGVVSPALGYGGCGCGCV